MFKDAEFYGETQCEVSEQRLNAKASYNISGKIYQ